MSMKKKAEAGEAMTARQRAEVLAEQCAEEVLKEFTSPEDLGAAWDADDRSWCHETVRQIVEQHVLAHDRETEARVWEEVEQILESESENVEYMDREAQHLLDRLCKRIAKQHAKALREEVGQR